MCRCSDSIPGSCLRAVLGVLCLLVAGAAHFVAALGSEEYRFQRYGTAEGLPTDNVQQVFQDSEGYMWFATRNGLARFDGFDMEVLKSNIRNGDILSNNNVNCLAEDSSHRLWIGTPDGLNVLDKTTGELRRIDRDEFRDNTTSCILTTRNGRILVGTDFGLYEYFADADSCFLFTREMTGDIMPQTSVKSLIEDSRGHIWIGTWNEGLYRLDLDGRFHSYPRMNERKSAHVVFEDSRHRIWVGTWEFGLYLLRNPYQPDKTTWVNFRHDPADASSLSDNIIYSISEEPETHAIWVGTRKGVSILEDGADSFSPLQDSADERPVSDVTSIMPDRQGMMWISMLGHGVLAAVSHNPNLILDRLEAVREKTGTNRVQRICVARDGRLWLGLGTSQALAVYDSRTGDVTTIDGHGFSSPAGTPYTIKSIMQARDGRMFIGTYDGGLYIVGPGAKIEHYMRDDTEWVAGNRVSEVLEDETGRIWTGALPGLTVRNPDGSFCRLDSLSQADINVNSMVQGADGSIWVGTQNLGVLRIDGTGTDVRDYSLARYSPDNGTMNSAMITVMYRDSHGRIWAGTDGAGLSLYDHRSDCFVPVHMKWNLPGDMISSILGDSSDNLWIGSNVGLLALTVTPDGEEASYRLFTSSDGAQDNIFNRNAACADSAGRMFFGGPRGINVVAGAIAEDSGEPLPVTLTDIKVFGTSWSKMEHDERMKVSAQAPGYTDCITLEHSQNNFSVEFAVLDYMNHPLQHKYAYKLDGFDNDWQYTDVGRRFAYYNNLSPGTYTFRVRATDAAGAWNGPERILKVEIKPPLWATWWAYVIYTIAIAALVFAALRIYRRRVRQKNELHLRELELAQAEQLNRTKLRFFTNITHEWLTPLSIISAAAEEMKADTPEQQEYHRIMTGSVNRLARLLQQVLEFRKAESGNLRLKVSEGNLSDFVRDITDSFMPVMKKHGISCVFEAHPADFKAWFDPDKIDKILYNLLSNASKYILPGCSVKVTLTASDDGKEAVLQVRDNGPGIPASRLPDLFKRFYEGEHRRFNTNGNGIGLSLTKDLVELHHGTIEVVSAEGEGTTFTVRIPVCRDAFPDSEIDSTMTTAPMPEADKVENDTETDDGNREKATLLVIEDDEDLLKLMARLLSDDYYVLTAADAETARDMLLSSPIDLIISDMMLPGMNGVEFCRMAKGRIESCHIPILLLTANSLEESEVDAYEAGADAFMSKPFSLNVLHARVANLLRTRRHAYTGFRRRFATEISGSDYSSLDENFLKKSVECITAHIDDADYSQTMFVEEMGISKSTLFRKLKSLTGLSYSAFVRNIRLKTACRIMQEKRGIRISELAYAVGFNDPKYFSLCFKKEFGILPSEYIERFTNNDKTENPPSDDDNIQNLQHPGI